MIYSTNRTTSLGEMSVDVNESYFGIGAYDFMQENAQDELAMFEAAIKSDIDECIIGESSYELQALHEGFVENAKNKIKEMMRKFIEWLKAVTRSAFAKLATLIVRDNEKFVKIARKQIAKMPAGKFEYSGKMLKLSNCKVVDYKAKADAIVAEFDKADNMSETELDTHQENIKNLSDEFKALADRDNFEKNCVEDTTKGTINDVQAHIGFLADKSKKQLATTKKALKEMEANAKKIAKKADKDSDKHSGDEDKVVAKRYSVKAACAAAYRDACQSFVKDTLWMIKEEVKIARRVVSAAMAASPKNEGFEYGEELELMVEADDFIFDEALEEMSEAKSQDIDHIDDLEDEE